MNFHETRFKKKKKKGTQTLRNKLSSLCNQVYASTIMSPSTFDRLQHLWSAVYQKNCHLVSHNPCIRAAPLLIWKIHTKTHPQQRDEEIVKILHQDCSKVLLFRRFFFLSIHLLGSVLSVCLLSSVTPSIICFIAKLLCSLSFSLISPSI